MRLLVLFLVAILAPLAGFSATLSGKWELTQSSLIYHVTHPLHKVAGKSEAARGKGSCDAKGCEFLVAVPVKSFDSKDGNRDSHMWETVKAGTYPIIQVHITSVSGIGSGDPKQVTVAAEVEFAGQKILYPKLQLSVAEWKKDSVRLKGTLPLSLKAFGIKAPSLLSIPVEDPVPVDLDLTWTRSSK